MLKKIERVLNTVEKRMLQVLFITMIVVVLAAVFNRITFNFQMAWSDEFSRYLFVWIVFIGSAYAAGDKAHIGVTALVDVLPEKCRRALEVLMYALCLTLSLALIYYTVTIMKVQMQYGQISPSMRLPMQYAYLGMAVGGVFMALHFILHIGYFFTNGKSDATGGELL